MGAQAAGQTNLHAADINGDTRLELIGCAAGAPFALEYGTGAYASYTNAVTEGVFVPYWQGPDVSCSGVAVGDVTGDGGTEIVVGTSSGRLLIFDPRSPAAKVIIDVPGIPAVKDVVVGNIDDDASLEIAVVTADTTFIYDGRLLSLQWTATGFGGNKARVGQIDADSRIELVVNGPTGWVLDAQAQTLDWKYDGGFGDTMTLGNVDADSYSEIVFVRNTSERRLSILNGDTFGTVTFSLWTTAAVDSAMNALSVGDSDGDGLAEIQVGSDALYFVDPATGKAKTYSGLGKVQAVTVADSNGDGAPEVILGSTPDKIQLLDRAKQAISWSSKDVEGEFSSAVADIDGDGKVEWIVTSRSSDNAFVSGMVEVNDIGSGKRRFWVNVPSTGGYGAMTSVAAGELYLGSTKEICTLLAMLPSRGLASPNRVIHVLDGVNGQTDWRSTATYTGDKILVHNVDDDPVDEIIAATTASNIVILNGASDTVQATKPFSGTFVDMSLVDLAGDGTPELIVATTTTLSVLSLPALALKVEIPLTGMRGIAGTAAGGGTIAVTFSTGDRLRTFSSTLTSRWSCSAFATNNLSSIAFARVGGSDLLLVADDSGILRSFLVGGTECAAAQVSAFPLRRFE